MDITEINNAIGNISIRKDGKSNVDIYKKVFTSSPLFTMRSIRRNDCVSHIILARVIVVTITGASKLRDIYCLYSCILVASCKSCKLQA